MKQFQIHLKSELGKLANGGDASRFLKSVSADVLKTCDLPIDLDQLVADFSSQEKVNWFVDSLPDASVKSLTRTCDRDWRRDGVYDTLVSQAVWIEVSVPLDSVYVQQAEPKLAYIFQRRGFQLKDTAGDTELWECEPYSKWNSSATVQFPILLGRFKSGRCKLFDGIHRAILLAKKGEQALTVYGYDA